MWIRHKDPNADKRGETKTMLDNAVLSLKPPKPTRAIRPPVSDRNHVCIRASSTQSPEQASAGIRTDLATSFPHTVQPITLDQIQRMVGGHSPTKTHSSSRASASSSRKSKEVRGNTEKEVDKPAKTVARKNAIISQASDQQCTNRQSKHENAHVIVIPWLISFRKALRRSRSSPRR